MTVEQFNSNLKYLKKHDKHNPLLDDIVHMGYTPVSCMYLESALNSMKVPHDAQGAIDHPEILQKIRDLITRRSILSNSFHDCNTTHERKEVSILINNVQSELKELYSMQLYYKKYGKLPTPKEKKQFMVPSDPSTRLKKILSLRATISRLKKSIEIKSLKGDLSEAKKRLDAFQSQLAQTMEFDKSILS